MTSYAQDYARRKGAYRKLSAVDVETVCRVLGLSVGELCETAQRCHEDGPRIGEVR